MRHPACFGGMALALLMATAGTPCEGKEAMPAGMRISSLVLPFQGPGQLVMIASRGWPPNDALVVATREGSRVVPFERPGAARWRSPQEIVVEQGGPGWSGKIVRMDSTGKILATITEGYFVMPEPAPDGRRLAVAHVLNDGGTTSLEIRELANGFRLVTAFSPDEIDLWLSAHPAWAPGGEQLVVAVTSSDYDIGERLQARLAIISPDTGTIKGLYQSRKDRKKDPRGLMPMFWNRSGIHAWSARGVLRCDPEGKGCDVVYNPGKGRHVIGGTAVGEHEALLLVADVKADPLEPRAKEIHRLNLKSGKGELWVRLPDDLFVWDIDWIDEPDANDQMRTIK